jgi:hypothetical protein
MNDRASTAHHLAARLLAGRWSRAAIAARLAAELPHMDKKIRRALADRLTAMGEPYPPAPGQIVVYLLASPDFKPAKRRPPIPLDPPRFAPAPPFAGLAIPILATPGELAAWLGVSLAHLDWLSDNRRTHDRTTVPRLQNYHYGFAPKRDGRLRLLEIPKPRLKAIQRRILRDILAKIPVHPAAHGFVSGRSCLSGAQVHAGEAVVLTLDLAQFFPAIALPRIHGLFRALGYPWAVARHLAGLCTTITPAAIFDGLAMSQRPPADILALHGSPHLPQGAPTSPALANLIAWTLDRRLRGLAAAACANYTRYADDIAVSGDDNFARFLHGFRATVAAILAEEGFALNPAKTRIMPAHAAQRVTGITVNRHCNVNRAEFDVLKATLHNCARTGPAEQNRANIPDFRAHLAGRIAWVRQVNPQRAAKLYRLFDLIDWRPQRPA